MVVFILASEMLSMNEITKFWANMQKRGWFSRGSPIKVLGVESHCTINGNNDIKNNINNNIDINILLILILMPIIVHMTNDTDTKINNENSKIEVRILILSIIYVDTLPTYS